MNGDPLVWVELWHPGLKTGYRCTEAAYEQVWQYNGWVLREQAAVPLLTQVLTDPDSATDDELRLVLGAVANEAFPVELEGADRETLLGTARVVAQHDGADTAVAVRLDQLREQLDVVEDPEGPYDPDTRNVFEVNHYLNARLDAGDEAEVRRVLAKEAAGQNRKGIVLDGSAVKKLEG